MKKSHPPQKKHPSPLTILKLGLEYFSCFSTPTLDTTSRCRGNSLTHNRQITQRIINQFVILTVESVHQFSATYPGPDMVTLLSQRTFLNLASIYCCVVGQVTKATGV